MSDTTLEKAPQSLAMLTPIARPAQLMEAHRQTVEFIKEVLQPGVDYGVIPGTGDKPALLKAGAERLTAGYGLRPEYDVIESEKDHDRPTPFTLTKWVKRDKPRDKATEENLKLQGKGRNRKFGNNWQWQESEIEEGTALGLYRYVIRCRLHLGEREVGQGIGSCSSLESKYIRNPRDSENIICKMAKKRAYVDAVLTTLGLSDRFTQDTEDIHANKAVVGDVEPIDAVFTEDPQNVQEPSETNAERDERLRALAAEQGRKAGAFLIETLGMDRVQFAEFQTYCKKEGVFWTGTALDCQHAGVTNQTQLWLLIKEGRKPGEAIVIEPTEPEPKATEQAPEPPRKTHKFELITTENNKILTECASRGIEPKGFMNEAWATGGRTFEDLMRRLTANDKPDITTPNPNEYDPFSD